MKFEAIVNSLGDFGRFQKTVYFIICLVAVPHAFQTLGIIFTMGNRDHRCSIPVLENDTYYVQEGLHKATVDEWIPKEEMGYSSCRIYVMDPTSHHVTNDTTTCSSYVYDKNTYLATITSDEDLVCDRKNLKTFANMAYMAGMLVGSIAMGSFSDSFGRKRALMTCIVCHVISSLVIAFVQSYVTFVILRFATAVFGVGVFIIAFVVGIEIVGPKTRKFAGIIIELYWVVGLLINVLLAYLVRDWRSLQIITAVPSILLLSLAFFIPESPRWLIRQGRFKEASEIIQKAAKMNKVSLGDEVIDVEMVDTYEGPTSTIWQMFTERVLLVRTLVLVYNWFSCSLVYFGLGLNVGSLSGDIYVNQVLFAVVEGLSYLSCLLLLDRVGRKPLMVFNMLMSGVACIATLFPVIYGSEDTNWMTVALSLVGKFGSSATFAVVFIYTAEIFPTPIRNLGIGLCSFFARIGGLLAPYIADIGYFVGGDLGVALPLIIFGGASLISGFLAFVLPDTTNRILPESIQDAKEFGRHSQDKISKNGEKTRPSSDNKSSIILVNGKETNSLIKENGRNGSADTTQI